MTEQTREEKEFEICKRNPYEYIMDWMEGNLLHVGRQVFKVLALQPCSLILPNIHFNSTSLRTSFNIMILAPPSCGKSTLCKKYEGMTYSPYPVRKVSSSQLASDLASMDMFSLILEDFSQIGDDYEVIKVIEGAIGDEKKISKKNKREIIDKDTQGVGLLCGTWSDLGRYMKYFQSGLLFRSFLMFIDLSKKQKEDIGDFINEGVGNKKSADSSKLKERVVRRYYKELEIIMAGEHKDIPQVNDYEFPPQMKKKYILDPWKEATEEYHDIGKEGQKQDFHFSRELGEGYRIAVSSALLNIFNRRVEDGVLYPTEEDFKLARDLMLQNLTNKISILKSKMFMKNIKSVKDLKSVLKCKIPSITKKILTNLYMSK